MERQIKFRAYIPALKIMLEEIAIYPNGTIGIAADAFGEYLKESPLKLQWDGDDTIYQYDEMEDAYSTSILSILPGDDWIWIEESNYELMQFTGLLDKNEMEIYKGDIVKCHYFYFNGNEAEAEIQGAIEWGGYGWIIEKVKGKHWEEHTDYKAGEGECTFLDLMGLGDGQLHEESFEVIGNIYKNPELLK